jgi:hypothetical protein
MGLRRGDVLDELIGLSLSLCGLVLDEPPPPVAGLCGLSLSGLALDEPPPPPVAVLCGLVVRTSIARDPWKRARNSMRTATPSSSHTPNWMPMSCTFKRNSRLIDSV